MKKLVLTLGTFDLFHAGHVRLLSYCADIGDTYVAVNPDDFVARFKGKAPIMPLADRLTIVRACRYVVQAFPNIGEEDSKPTIELWAPTHIVVGADWKDRDYLGQLKVTETWLQDRGIEIVYYMGERVGSSELKQKIRNQ